MARVSLTHARSAAGIRFCEPSGGAMARRNPFSSGSRVWIAGAPKSDAIDAPGEATRPYASALTSLRIRRATSSSTSTEGGRKRFLSRVAFTISRQGTFLQCGSSTRVSPCSTS